MIEFTLDTVHMWQMVLSTVFPLLVGLVTKKVTHSGVKAVLLAVIALAGSIVTEFISSAQHGSVWDLGQTLLMTIPSFLIAVGMHFGIWKPTGAAEALQEIGDSSKAESFAPEERAEKNL